IGLPVGTHTATVTVSGGANITAQTFDVSFTVTPAPTFGISFTLPATIRRNQTVTPVLTVFPANAYQGVRWTSSSPALASVDSNTGMVTARATSGVVVITATTLCGNFRHSVTVRLSA
ncbi:MAG: Ig-like domain-containing protein, partial [Oscillospiraceae bacterium]|nr:Ig-like domain-containing protein [Oscillospiraceae bacterium]